MDGKNKKEQAFFIRFFSTILFIGIDILMYNIGMWLAIWVRGWFTDNVSAQAYFRAYYDLTLVMVLLPPLFFIVAGVYRRRWIHARIEDLIIIIRAVALLAIGMLIILYPLRGDVLTRQFPLGALPVSFVIVSFLVCGWRVALQWFTRKGLNLDKTHCRTLLIGPTGLDPEIILRIRHNTNPHYELIGCLEDDPDHQGEIVMGLPRIGNTNDFVDVIEAEKIDTLIVVASQISSNQCLDIVHYCDKHNMDYQVVPSLVDMMTTNPSIRLINYIPMVHYGTPTISGWPSLLKRMFDVVASTLSLVMLGPLLLVVTILIRLDSSGPAIFKQWRVGRDGNRFRFYKFRTMVQDAEAKGALTTDNDPRITRIGRFLRKTSIDELPQLFNVLIGQMSLVGPRAVVPFVADKFNEHEQLTLNVQPGLTGLAQVSGRDALGFYDKSLLNLYYIRNYSFLLDLKIILKTVQVVLHQEGTEGARLMG